MIKQQLTIKQAAVLAGVPRGMIWRRCKTGHLDAAPDPRDLRRRLIDRDQLERIFGLDRTRGEGAAA